MRRIFGQGAAPTSAAASSSAASARRPSTSFSSAASRPSFNRAPARQAHVAEQVDGDDLGDDERLEDGDLDAEEGEAPTLEEVLQTEVEQLADEIAQAEEEGIDPAHLEALESGIETSAELVSMREARTRLAEVRKDRGFKGPAVASAGGGKGSGGQPKAKASVISKKMSGKHACFDCGLSGHWAGDPECQKPGAGLGRPKAKAASRQVRLAEAGGTDETSVVEPAAGDHEVLAVSSLSLLAALRASSSTTASSAEALASGTFAADKGLVGALGSACNRTCAGIAWLEDYIGALASAPPEILALVTQKPEAETFRFGNGGVLFDGSLADSYRHLRAPRLCMGFGRAG